MKPACCMRLKLLCVLLAGLCSCAGSQDKPEPVDQLAAGLPALDSLRGLASTVDHFQDGAAPQRQSAGFAVEGTSGRLDASDGGSFEYAIFGFDPGAEPLIEVVASISELGPSDAVYLARSNYSSGLWELDGPFESGVMPLEATLPLDSAEHLSAGGSVYCAVIAPLGSNALLEQVSFRSEGNIPPVAILTADVESGDPNLLVNFSGDQSYDPDGSIVSYQWDLDGDGLLEEITGDVPQADHNFGQTGYYKARLRVTDNQGLSASSEPLGITVHGTIVRTILDPDDPAADFSLCTIDGRPRLSFMASDLLFYLESETEFGTGAGDWDAVALEPPYGLYQYIACMAEVAGRPALVCNSEDSEGNPVLLYARTNSGDARVADNWGYTNITSLISYCSAASLALVEGNPAVVFEDNEATSVLYARSSTPDGSLSSDWTTIEILDDQHLVVESPSLTIVEGNPAFVHRHSPGEDLHYMRSSTPLGLDPLDWQPTVLVSAFSIADASMTLVDGHPAVAYQTGSTFNLRYRWSTTPLGMDQSEWLDVPVEVPGTVGNHCVVLESFGRPCILYIGTDTDTLRLARSSSAHGTAIADWTDISIASGADSPSEDLAFALVGGFPALAYYDTGLGVIRYAVFF